MMSTLAFISFLPFVALSLFNYSQEECDYVSIIGVYSSPNQSDVLLLHAENTRRDNVFTERACMLNPTWKIYDTRNTNEIKLYGETSDAASSNPQCLADQIYEIQKDPNSISTLKDDDFATLKLELYVTDKSQELACEYNLSDVHITQENVCEKYVEFSDLYFMGSTDTLVLNVSSPFNDYSCSSFALPTFKVYNNGNNKLWGKMSREAQTYCLQSGLYPIINNGTTDDGFEPDQPLSMTIELWTNWRTFACSWEWDGIINFNGSQTFEPSMSPSMAPSEQTLIGNSPSAAPIQTEDPVLNNQGSQFYNIVIMVFVLLLVLF